MNEQSDPAIESNDRSGPEERDYLLGRARHHQQLAENTDKLDSKAIHLRFQQIYEERAERAGMVHPD